MKKKNLLFLLTFGFLSALFSSDEDWFRYQTKAEPDQKGKFFLGSQNWDLEHDVDFELTSTLLSGSDVNAEDDLLVDVNESAGRHIAGYHHEDFVISLAFFEQKLEGSNALSREIALSDVIFQAGITVETKIDIKEVSLSVEKDFYTNNTMSLGWILNGEYYSLNVKANSSVMEISEKKSGFWVAPGLKIRQQLPWNFAVEGRAQGIEGSLSSTRVAHIDYSGLLRWEGLQYLDVEIGYRFFRLDGSSRDFKFDIKSSGPYFGLSLTF